MIVLKFTLPTAFITWPNLHDFKGTGRWRGGQRVLKSLAAKLMYFHGTVCIDWYMIFIRSDTQPCNFLQNMSTYWPIVLFQGFAFMYTRKGGGWRNINRMIFHPISLMYPVSKWSVSGDWEWNASKPGDGVCIDLPVDEVLYHIILTKATILTK